MSGIKKTIRILAWAAVWGALASYASPLSIFVSVIPQRYFVERIGGDRVQVEALVQPGDSPATYDANPRQMAALSDADLFFRIGVPFEQALIPKISRMMPQLTMIDTRRGITLRPMTSHRHDDDHDSDASGRDPHIWLDPKLVKIQARTIADALISIDPEGTLVYENNLRDFQHDLDVLDEKLTQTLAPLHGQTFLVFHPSWGYFAHSYGLEQEAIEVEGKNPSARQLARIVDQAEEAHVKVIYVQPQFSKSTAEAIARIIHGRVVPIDPLAYDYITNLEHVGQTIKNQAADQK